MLVQCVEAAAAAQPAAPKAAAAISATAYLPRRVGEPKKVPATAAKTSSLRLNSPLAVPDTRVAAQKAQPKKGQPLQKKVQVASFTSSNLSEP